MPFVGAGIVPHSPLLVPTVGKEYHRETKRTQHALASLVQELYALRPDCICVIHPHGTTTSGLFPLQTAHEFVSDFSEFGDLVTSRTWPVALTLAHEIMEHAEDHGFPVRLVNERTLTHDVAVPLNFFPSFEQRVEVLPIGTSPTLDRQTHVHWGSMLAETFHRTQKRVVVLVSAELSQHASAAASGGVRPEGERFDRDVQSMLRKKNLDRNLMSIDGVQIELAAACGFEPLLVWSGISKRKNLAVRKLSYEHPFGIGFIVALINNA
jgi:aromatic ring-opening dioxygenase LigB subunit